LPASAAADRVLARAALPSRTCCGAKAAIDGGRWKATVRCSIACKANAMHRAGGVRGEPGPRMISLPRRVPASSRPATRAKAPAIGRKVAREPILLRVLTAESGTHCPFVALQRFRPDRGRTLIAERPRTEPYRPN
jgi:hypothetical protein